MKRLCRICLKNVLVVSLIVLSAAAIYINHKGNQFDPIREIKRLESQNRRDDAMDLARFYRYTQSSDAEKFAKIEKELEYTSAERLKTFIWYGAIKGEVYDTYSALGAISTDLCVVGDIRDLGIQTLKYLTGSLDFDKSITFLSAVGVCLSGAPYLDGVDALIKNTVKYLKRIPACLNRGLLKKLLTGKISRRHYKKIWELLKKTSGQSPEPYPAYPISAV